MATAVEQAIAEIDNRLKVFEPEMEGLQDYNRLNLQPHTTEVVRTAIAAYDKRLGLLHTAKLAMQALMDDGHPDLPVQEIDASVLDDLNENASTIEAAHKRFSSNAATSMALGAGSTEKK